MKSCKHPCCPDTGPCRKLKPKSQPKRIQRESKKRAKQNRQYRKKRIVYLQKKEECEVKLPGCSSFATEVHHLAGRVGEALTDEKNFLAVCRNCHNQIELNPEMAKINGYSKSRLIKIS